MGLKMRKHSEISHIITLPHINREQIVAKVKKRLDEAGLSLADAIRERNLYFRVSVVGACDLNCQFCHNEGGPKKGLIDLEIAEKAIISAVSLGFTRVQFTGGEPLIRKDISSFISVAKRHIDDVGITTNGTYLMRELDNLVNADITRIHVSLQTESLIESGSNTAWGIPDWLAPIIERANTGSFLLRLNLPVPANNIKEAEDFLHLMEIHCCGVRVFSVLPERTISDLSFPLDELEAMVNRINKRRKDNSRTSEVLLRGFLPPSGIRCPTCNERARCKEQSHSLRLGADMILRPCLASREWDIPLCLDPQNPTLTESALLALDY